MRKRVLLETMEISSIMISFSSDNESLICVFFLSEIAGRLSPVSLGIARAVFTVVPPMFMAETPVRANLKVLKVVQDYLLRV